MGYQEASVRGSAGVVEAAEERRLHIVSRRGELPALQQPEIRPASRRLHQMDGLRGIAMLFVFLGHFSNVWADLAAPSGSGHFFLRLVDADATYGSSLFMLLSGFFAYGSLRRGSAFGPFFKGRLLRLYPMYLLTVCLYLGGCFVFPRLSKLPADPVEALQFLVGNLLLMAPVFHTRLLVDVSWTLSFVVLFYLIGYAVVRCFRSLGTRRIFRFCTLVVAALLWAWVGERMGYWEPRTAIFWTGMAMLEAVEGYSSTRPLQAARLVPWALLLFLAGVAGRTLLMLERPDTGPIPQPILCFAITSLSLAALLWVSRFGPEWWKQLLSTRWLLQLGAASYSFYLTHGLTLKLFRFFIIPKLGLAAYLPQVFWVSQLLGLVVSIVVARIAFVLVEQPVSELAFRGLQRQAGERRGAATPA